MANKEGSAPFVERGMLINEGSGIGAKPLIGRTGLEAGTNVAPLTPFELRLMAEVSATWLEIGGWHLSGKCPSDILY